MTTIQPRADNLRLSQIKTSNDKLFFVTGHRQYLQKKHTAFCNLTVTTVDVQPPFHDFVIDDSEH